MLIDTIRDVYRELTGRITPVEPLVMVPMHRPAANAGNFTKSNMQARRLRRQRRLERFERRRINGWTVRTW